jgi:hypothetical protein
MGVPSLGQEHVGRYRETDGEEGHGVVAVGIASAWLGSDGLGVGGGQALARGRLAARRQ